MALQLGGDMGKALMNFFGRQSQGSNAPTRTAGGQKINKVAYTPPTAPAAPAAPPQQAAPLPQEPASSMPMPGSPPGTQVGVGPTPGVAGLPQASQMPQPMDAQGNTIQNATTSPAVLDRIGVQQVRNTMNRRRPGNPAALGGLLGMANRGSTP